MTKTTIVRRSELNVMIGYYESLLEQLEISRDVFHLRLETLLELDVVACFDESHKQQDLAIASLKKGIQALHDELATL